MKTRNHFIAMARHGWRSSNALDGVFAKQKLQRTKLTWMLILFAIALAVIGCKNDEPTPNPMPTDDNTLQLLLGDKSYTATVKGLIDTELIDAKGKIKTAIEGRYTSTGDAGKVDIKQVFDRGVTIIVEKTPTGYTKWKTTTDGKTMYLAFGALGNDLQTSIATALARMTSSTADSA
jgi:hypothetical protein